MTSDSQSPTPNPQPPTPFDFLLLALVLAVAVGMRVIFLHGDPPIFLTTDSLTYALPAIQLAHGEGFDLSLRRTPGYPLFLAALWGAFGDDTRPIVYAQHLLGTATAGLTFLLGRLAFGRLAGLLGGLAVALSGPQILYEHYLMTESLFTLLTLLGILTLVLALRRDSGRLYLAAGFIFGLCALTRPIGQIFPLFVPLAVILARRCGPNPPAPFPTREGGVGMGPVLTGSTTLPGTAGVAPDLFSATPPSRAGKRVGGLGLLTSAIRPTVLALVGFGLVVLPWMGRNLVFGGELTGSSALGKTLFGRITRHDDGFRFDLPPAGAAERDARRAEARAVARAAAQEDTSRGSLVHERLIREFGYSEAQAYNVMRDVALEVLLAQPAYFVQSSLGHVVTLFRGQEEPLRVHLARLANPRLRSDWQAEPELAALLPAPVTPEERGRTLRSAIDVVRVYEPSEPRVAVLLGVLFIIGTLAVLMRRAWLAAVPLPMVVLTVLVLSAFLDGPVPRFRYSVDPFISLTAAAGLVATLQVIRRAVPSRVPSPESRVPSPRSKLAEPAAHAQRAELT